MRAPLNPSRQLVAGRIPAPLRSGRIGWPLVGICWVAMLALSNCGGETSPGATSGSSATRSAQPPNLLVILSDTHRFDHVSPLDDGRRLTPNLALLARDGLRFTAARTPIPISAPAYATLLTGLPPTPRQAGGHGLLNNHQHLGNALPRLPVLLRRHGYRTAAVIANPFCSTGHGFAEGFDFFWDGVEGVGKGGEHVSREAIAWLDRSLEGQGDAQDPAPFFLFVATMDAHTPWVDPTSQPSLLARIDGEPCCLLWAENSHVEQRIPFVARPGSTTVTLDFVDDHRRHGTGLAVSEPAGARDSASPLYIVEPRLSDERLGLEAVLGLDPPAEGSSFRRLSRRTLFTVTNPTTEPIAGELSFHGYRRYGPEDSPSRYAAGVRAADRHIGTLLAALERRGLDQNTVVVFLSDHGEMLGEHDAWGHVDHLWRQTLHIPLIVKAPGRFEGGEHGGDFDLAELYHLLLALAGHPSGVQGTAKLAELTRGAISDDTDEPSAHFAVTYPPEASTLKVVARRGELEFHLDAEGRVALYDLATDPTQATDLFPERRDRRAVRQLLAEARGYLGKVRKGSTSGLDDLDEAARRQLEALGYLD